MSNLTNYKKTPFDLLVNEFFGYPVQDSLSPKVNIKESDKEYTLEVIAPGYDKSKFEIKVENDMINISNKIESSTEDKSDKYTRREFFRSSFSRSFKLPKNINSESIEAKYENGILTIDIPKSENPKKSKQIEIK